MLDKCSNQESAIGLYALIGTPAVGNVVRVGQAPKLEMTRFEEGVARLRGSGRGPVRGRKFPPTGAGVM